MYLHFLAKYLFYNVIKKLFIFFIFSLSVRSRSPDENSSQCSFDHSREEEICQEYNMTYDSKFMFLAYSIYFSKNQFITVNKASWNIFDEKKIGFFLCSIF